MPPPARDRRTGRPLTTAQARPLRVAAKSRILAEPLKQAHKAPGPTERPPAPPTNPRKLPPAPVRDAPSQNGTSVSACTKRATTFLVPAFSKAISSLSPSMPMISP